MKISFDSSIDRVAGGSSSGVARPFPIPMTHIT
jgi:hypothetical protein